MKHLGSHAGYVVVDHSNSPGLRPEDVAHVPGMVAVGAGQVWERDFKICTHCQATVILNPGRVRSRAVCPSCYHYICDECDVIQRARGGICVPFVRVLDRAQEKVEKFIGQPDHPEAQLDLADLSKPPEPRIVLTDG